MALTADIKKKLESQGFTADEIKEIENGYLRQDDYSRHMNEIKTQAAEFQTKNDQLTKEMTDWAGVQATTEKERKEQTEALERLEREKFQLSQVVTRAATQLGVDPKELMGGELPIEPKPKAPEPFDPTPLMNTLGGGLKYMLDLATDLPVIEREHFALTGEYLDTRKLRAEVEKRAASKQSTSPVEVWEAMFDIPTKRAEKAKQDHAAEITAAEQRGREAAKSEAAIPGGNAPGSHAPVFTGQRQSVLQRPQPGRNTAGFAQSLASGKYKNGAPSGAR